MVQKIKNLNINKLIKKLNKMYRTDWELSTN